MSEVQWIKLFVDIFDKPKTGKIRRFPDGDKILLFWIMLLAQAGKNNAGGKIFITEKVPFAEEDLADEFHFEISIVKLALKVFVELDMIYITDDGFIVLCNWEKYQNTDKLAELREYNRVAKQRSREKKKLLKDVNDMSMTCQPCQDIEEDEDKDKEKEFHSFIPRVREDETDEKESAKLEYLGGDLGKGVVLLSEDQFADLCDKLSFDELNKYISIIADCELNGKKFKKKSHYQAILDMVKKDRRLKATRSDVNA